MADSKLVKKKGTTFTRMNVQRAVQEVKDTDSLRRWLGVPNTRREEIKRQFSSVPQQVKAYINYFMDHDPLASWRSVIVALDRMGEKEAADKIRDLAEPITDPTLNYNILRRLTASVKKWRDLGDYLSGLGVPRAVLNEINTAYQTEEEMKEALLLYFLKNVPMASWQRVAGALHSMREKTALEAVRAFTIFTPAEPSLTPENLSTVLVIMEDRLWELFGVCVNIPRSELGRIESQCSSDRERKQAVIPYLISHHPCLSWTLIASALYRMVTWDGADSSHRALDRLQQLFPTGRYRFKQIYEREMKLGCIQLDIDKILFFGLAGNGKTSALAVLLGLPPPDIRCSTPLMKRPITVIFMSVNEKMEWTERTQEQMQDIVAEVIRSRDPRQQAAAQSDASQSRRSKSKLGFLKRLWMRKTKSSSSSSQPTPSSEAAAMTTPSSEDTPTDGTETEAGGELDSLLSASQVDEEFLSLINSAPSFLKPILQMRQILILDSGGQPELLEMLSVFLNGASKFTYVFKAHESLDMRAMIQYFKDGKLVGEYEASLTNEEIMKQCIRTMKSLNAKNPDIPPAKMLFLATHRDMVPAGELPGVLESLQERMRKILLPQFNDQIIYCNKTRKDFIFAINAANPDDVDRECGQAIRECLSKSEGREPVKVPMRWHTLYHKLLEVMNVLGKKVLPREQCRQVAESMDIDDESCEEALNFFNGLNVLFYYPAILPNLVFVDPQMLLDKLSELVDECYQTRESNKLEPVVGEKLKFHDYGQVTEKFMSEFETHYEPPLFTHKELITLMKGLLVLADLSEDTYFMPCLLRVVTSEVVRKHQVSGEKALAIHFPDSGPLMGMYCSTVAYLLSPNNTYPSAWRVLENDEGNPECIHRNVIKFTVSDFTGTASLIDHFTHFEIHVDAHPTDEAELWKLAHDAVFAGIEKARKTIGYTNNTPVPAIVCPAHSATPHPATMRKGVWKCSKDSRKYGNVSDCTIPWLSVCNTPTTVARGKKSDKSPTPVVTSATPAVTSVTSVTSATPAVTSVTSATPAAAIETIREQTEKTTSSKHTLKAEPNMPDLLRLRVPQTVGPHYYTFGILLLNDITGSRLASMEIECSNSPERITRKILQEWLEGKGLMPVSWETLINTLRDTGLPSLADQIQSAPFLSVATMTGGKKSDKSPTPDATMELSCAAGTSKKYPASVLDDYPSPQLTVDIKRAKIDQHQPSTVAGDKESDTPAVTSATLAVVEGLAQKTVLVTNEEQHILWEEYGLRLHIPSNSLPEDCSRYELKIDVGLPEEFELPGGDGTIVSAVYSFSHGLGDKKLCRPVTLEMQHCAASTALDNLSIIRANTYSNQFVVVPEGDFTSSEGYGAIKLFKFSRFTEWLKRSFSSFFPIEYSARIFYTNIMRNQFHLEFCIIRNMRALSEAIKADFAKRDESFECGPGFRFQFQANEIHLEIPKSCNGWKMKRLNPLVVCKQDVDSYTICKDLYPCVVRVWWDGDGNPAPLVHEVKLNGAKDHCDFLTVTSPMRCIAVTSTTLAVTSVTPTVTSVTPSVTSAGPFVTSATLCMASTAPSVTSAISASEIPTLPKLLSFPTTAGSINITEKVGTDYKALGIMLLKDDDGTLVNQIASDCHHKSAAITLEILERWIRGGGRQPVTWQTLTETLKIIGLTELASTIESSLSH